MGKLSPQVTDEVYHRFLPLREPSLREGDDRGGDSFYKLFTHSKTEDIDNYLNLCYNLNVG